MEAIVNPVAFKPHLTPTLKGHQVFHVSLLKPVGSSPMTPPTSPLPPPHIVDGDPVYTVKEILSPDAVAGVCSIWLTGKATVWKSVSGSPAPGPSLLHDFHTAHPSKQGSLPGSVR